MWSYLSRPEFTSIRLDICDENGKIVSDPSITYCSSYIPKPNEKSAGAWKWVNDFKFTLMPKDSVFVFGSSKDLVFNFKKTYYFKRIILKTEDKNLSYWGFHVEDLEYEVNDTIRFKSIEDPELSKIVKILSFGLWIEGKGYFKYSESDLREFIKKYRKKEFLPLFYYKLSQIYIKERRINEIISILDTLFSYYPKSQYTLLTYGYLRDMEDEKSKIVYDYIEKKYSDNPILEMERKNAIKIWGKIRKAK
ncbi:MAG: hypothetical protein ABIN15_05460 [candidate division WOR-3 bacterium]